MFLMFMQSLCIIYVNHGIECNLTEQEKWCTHVCIEYELYSIRDKASLYS